MAKIFKSTGPVAKKIRRTEKSIAAFHRPDLASESAVEMDPADHETAVERTERLYHEAYTSGHAAGMEAGLARFNELVGEAHKSLESAGVALQQAHATFLDSMEPQVVELAKTVAARILRREARSDIDLVRNTVRAALENLAERKHAIVRLNPADAQALTERGVSLEDLFQSFDHVEIATDENVAHGGCTIETKTVDVDARLDTQLARIFEALEE